MKSDNCATPEDTRIVINKIIARYIDSNAATLCFLLDSLNNLFDNLIAKYENIKPIINGSITDIKYLKQM